MLDAEFSHFWEAPKALKWNTALVYLCKILILRA